MKILFAIKSLALAGGGAERVATEIANRLAARRHEVTMLTFDAPGYASFYPLDPAVTSMPIGIGNVAGHSSSGEILRRVATMRRSVRSLQPDVAVGVMHSSYIPLGVALLGTGIPLVASEHISYDHYRDRPLQAALLRLTPWLARTITVLSEPVRAGFPAPFRRAMTVVPNPVSPPSPAQPASRHAGPNVLLAMGRLEAQKDHRVLIEAFGRIAAQFPDWRLRIVGEGVLRGELEAQVREFGLEGRVELPGVIEDVGREYASAKVFAMPSAYESFGLTTAEALSHGLPVVGFADCPGTNELVRHEMNGLLVEGTDRAGALASALSRLLGSATLREQYGARGPASIEVFAPDRIADLWQDLLHGVVAGVR